MTNGSPVQDRAYIARRVKEETAAALKADDPKVAAVHAHLATEYLRTLSTRAS